MLHFLASCYPSTQASDVWSIGLLAHEMMTLQHPFHGTSLASMLQRILVCDYDQELLANAPYPEELKVVASSHELLHVDPTKRLTLTELLARPMFKQV